MTLECPSRPSSSHPSSLELNHTLDQPVPFNPIRWFLCVSDACHHPLTRPHPLHPPQLSAAEVEGVAAEEEAELLDFAQVGRQRKEGGVVKKGVAEAGV